jgi:hypothetical protein
MAMADKDERALRWLIALFWSQVASFVTLLSSMLVPFLRVLVRPAFLPLMGVNSILGLVLFVFSIRANLPKALKRFLILTGASSAGLGVSGVLHNAFYALAEIAGDSHLLRQAAGGLEIVFFIVAVFVCPVCFIVGVLGSIIVLVRSRYKRA